MPDMPKLFRVYSYAFSTLVPIDRNEPDLTNRPQVTNTGFEPRPRKHFDPQAWVEDWHFLRRLLHANAWPIVIATGVILRIFGIFRGRSFWLDESMLYQNLIDAPVFRVFGPLKQEQVVPPGFLMLLRAIHAGFGPAVIPLRFPAFLAGTTAFVLFALWARKSLPRPVGRVAAWLMAVNADALYYCQEMKPYAFDLLCAVVLIIQLDRRIRMTALSASAHVECLSAWRWRTAGFLFVIPWFSIAAFFPSAAFLTIVFFVDRKDRPNSSKNLLMAAAWGISFLAAWTIEKSQVVEGSVLWNFWDYAFLKPHRPIDTLCVLADNLINPLHLMTGFSSPWLMFPWAITLVAVLGFGVRKSMALSPWLAGFGSLATGLVAMASLARAYPFHGRTILVLLPFGLTFFAFGIAMLPIRSIRRRNFVLILALITPSASALHIRPFSNNRLISFDGDLEHDHFTRQYGVVKRANASPPRLIPQK